MAKKDPLCPLLGKPCVEHGCRFWIQVFGHNPNTGEPVNRFDCAVSWLPILLIENSQQQRQTGAAVESFRNEMVKGQHDSALLLAAMTQPAALEAPRAFD
ncbi:MAG: hypothetical protein MUE39_10350 [Gammaproteobacteria bacterium]|jgi:hypothetical protein|nr:hypothetical protein [Gammaproteobacteria bacterium]